MLLGQRDVDAVVGRRGLQLEVEAAAEALAQREPPRLVEPSAERRVQDELLPAALVEEALRNNRRLRRHRAEHGAPRDDVATSCRAADCIDAALAPSATRAHPQAAPPARRDARPRSSPLGVSRLVRRSISSRSSLTPSQSTAVRCGASPSQNGMLGGAPCASSTSTLPCGSMR